jgi:ATP-dependent RNA helicase RhlE
MLLSQLGACASSVVATPGRRLDLADHNAARLSGMSTLVLDEADGSLMKGSPTG